MINENLKQICLKRGISAYRLSKLANIPISVAAKIIRGEVKNPRIDSVIKMADALDVTLDELVGRKRKIMSGGETPPEERIRIWMIEIDY